MNRIIIEIFCVSKLNIKSIFSEKVHIRYSKRSPIFIYFYFFPKISFFSRLFTKKRSFDQPVLQKWIEVFTTELPKSEDIQFLNPLFGHLLQQLPAKSHTTESIYNINGDEELKESQNEQFDQRKFLEDKFELNNQIDPNYWKFISNIDVHKNEIVANPKICKMIYPYLMRFFIHYNYQFNLQASNFFQNPTKDNELFQNVKYIIPLIYLFPHLKTEMNDIIMCLSEFIDQLKKYLCTPNNFFHDQILRSIANEIFASCHILLAPIDLISLKYSLPVQLSFLYYNSFCTIFGVEDISLIEIEYLISTLSMIPRIDILIFQSSYEKFLSPIVDGSFHVLNVLHNIKISDSLTRQSFCLGTSIIDKFTRLFKMNIENNFAFMKQYSEGMIDIAFFILWCLDHFPINTLSNGKNNDYFPFNPQFHDPDYRLIPSEVTANIHFSNFLNYQFIDTPTFSEPVKTASQINEGNSFFYDSRFKMSEFQFPDIIKNRSQILFLATKIVIFMHALSDQNIAYLKKFVEVILDIIFNLFDNELTKKNKLSILNTINDSRKTQVNKNQQVYDVIGHNLPLSFYYFIISIFNKCNSNMICACLLMIHNGFERLLHPCIFSPFINKWVSKSFISNIHVLITNKIDEKTNDNEENFSEIQQEEDKNEKDSSNEKQNNEIKEDKNADNDFELAEKNKDYFEFVFKIRHVVIRFLNVCFYVTSSSGLNIKDQISLRSKKSKILSPIMRSQSQQSFILTTTSSTTFLTTQKISNSPSKEKTISNVRIDENSSFSECFEFGSIAKKDMEYNFDIPFHKERTAFLMMSSIYALFNDSSPQIFDEIVPLLLSFIKSDPDFLIKSSNKAGTFEMLMNHTYDLQLLHIGLKKENQSKYKKYLKNVESSRLNVFRIFDEFLRTNGGKLFFFGSQQFVQFLVHFLFEQSVMNFASDLIKRCVMLNGDSISTNSNSNQFKIIFRNISELIKTAIGHLGDFQWIKLILVLLDSLKEAFAINRNSIFDYLRSQQILLHLSRLPIEVVRSNPSHFILFKGISSINDDEIECKDNQIDLNYCLNFTVSEEDQPYMKIFEDVFDIFIFLSRENTTFAKDLASSYDGYYDNITSGLKMIIFGKSIIDRLLSLVFEQPISIDKLPSAIQIRNYFALNFLFNSTTHLPFHPMLMNFLADICIDSVSNKLRVFQAHLPELIIDYLQNFPSQNEQPKIVIDSIAISLRLFSIVSQYVFSVPTLFKCIQAMRTKDGHRVWWTGQLLCLFSTYIENSAKSSPCAFFYLDGRHTGFFIKDEISQLTLSKGWSFMCRFELDSIGFSNIGGVFPVLLYMQFKNGDSFSISFTTTNKKPNSNSNVKALRITYQTASFKSHNSSPSNNDANSKYWSEVVDDFEIQANKWYDLIFSSDFNLYISTINNINNVANNQYYSLSLKNTKKVDLKQCVQTASIGNTPPVVASEAPLVANISSFYFFTGTMNSKTVELLLSLPLSFAFSFSPSERKLDPRLPERLFNDAFDSRLFLGINARQTDGSTCFNIAKKSDIQSCTFRGIAFPFSTSFIDIINYSGGLKLFLPLFEQVNLSMYKEETLNDNSTFFQQLISMIQSFFQHSKPLDADFVRYDGFKAMSYSLMKIQSQYYLKNIIYSLFIICTNLEPEFRSIMIDEIWLNFNIWKRLSVDIQSYIYNFIFNELRSSENFRDHIQIGELCAVIAEQPVSELRQYLWRLLASMSQIYFTPDEQDSLFSFLFLKENVPFQLEALQCFYELCCLNINDICSVFQRKGKFYPFLQLLGSNQEKVRLISLKIIFVIYHFYKSNLESTMNYNPTFSDQFDSIILTAVHQLIMDDKLNIQMIDPEDSDTKSEKFTQDTWKTIMSIAFNNETSSDLRFIVPIACSCSHFFDNQTLTQFQSTIELLLESNSAAAKNITDCSRWYFWLLYFSIQKAENKYNFLDREIDATIFGRLFEYMVQIDRVDEVVFFFNWICYTRKWNTMPFLNLIFEKYLSSFKKCQFPKFINIVFEIFIYLFYIKNNERYSKNVQLHAKHSQVIKNNLLDEIDSCISLEDYIKINNNNDNLNEFESSVYFSFSMRITEDGNWLDSSLAKKLISFISDNSEKKGVTTLSFSKIPKIKLTEIFAFLIYSVIRVDSSIATIKSMLTCIKQFYSQRSIDSLSFKFITTAFAKVSISSKSKEQNESEESITQILNDFYKQNSTLMNDLNADFNDTHFCLNVIQDYGADISAWLEIIQGFTINVCEIYKQRYSTYFPLINETINKINKPFHMQSYTEEMDDNCIALKRKQRRNRSLSAKIFRRFQKAMTVNGGPWCDNKTENHWKLASRTDKHMRHLFVRPNWHFDIHKVASLRRDKSKNEQAKLEYQRWIENQDQAAASTEFSMEDAEDIQQEQMQQQQQQPTKSQYQFSATMITIAAVYEGNLSLNRTEVCFDGVQVKDEYLFSIEGSSSKTVEFNLSDIVWVLHRSYLHIDRGLEFFCNDGCSYFFYFSLSDRNQILKILSDYRPPNLLVLQRTSSQRCFSEQRFTEKWLNKEMSTYDYLMTVNFFAGRSFNDLSQYPVFPWILADYTSEKIDVDANPPPPGLFRDLSKPVGALNEKRLAKLKKELEVLRESKEEMNMSSDSCLNETPCLYRCHYSTAYYVLLYMIRLEPFTTMHILMQDNKFDHPDRLFAGIEKAWRTVSSTSNDFRELIPEFFTLPEFLTNSDGFNLGLSDKEGNNVLLPKWAKNPYWFITTHRRALESEYVAQNIGNWIDLIFGCKQNGQAAEEANNTFHAYCYPSIINSPEVKANHELLYEVQKHAGSFGIIPRQLFTTPHPNFPAPNATSQNEQHQNENHKLDDNQIQRQSNNNDQQRENKFALSEAYKADSEIVSLFVSTHLYFVTNDGKILRLKPKQFIFESSAQIPFDIGKCTAIFPKLKLFVVTSPSGDAFHTFSFDSYSNLTHIFSFRQQFSSLTTIASVGDSILVVLSQDGSLTVWDFSTNFTPKNIPSSNSVSNINSILNNTSNGMNSQKRARSSNLVNTAINSDQNDILFAKEEFSYLPVSDGINNSSDAIQNNNSSNFKTGTISFAQTDAYRNSFYDPIYKVNHHLVSAVCVTASNDLRLIVSCDTSRRIVLTELSDGSFIRSFSIPDESAVPVGLLILDAGFISTFCEHRSHNDVRSSIQIYALDSTMLSIFDHPRRVTTFCAINLVNGQSFIAVGFEDAEFVILGCPDASVVHTMQFSSPITAISQKDNEKLLFLANAEKQIFSLVLDL